MTVQMQHDQKKQWLSPPNIWGWILVKFPSMASTSGPDSAPQLQDRVSANPQAEGQGAWCDKCCGNYSRRFS